MMNTRRIVVVMIALGFGTLALLADVVYLNDGRQIRGTFLGGDSRSVRFLSEDGRQENLPIGSIERIVFSSGSETSAAPITSAPAPALAPTPRPALTVPAISELPMGTVLVVRMIDGVSSDKNEPGDVFKGTLEKAVLVDGSTAAPKGAPVEVQLVHVKQSGQLRGEEEIALQLRKVTINNKTYLIDTTFAELASEGKGGQTAKVVGGTAAVGAIIGAIAGGKKGAAVGAGVGAGAGVGVQVLRGKEVKVPSESLLSFTLKESLKM